MRSKVTSEEILEKCHVCIHVQSLGNVSLFATLWTVVHQAALSKECSRQEYWTGLPFPTPEDLPPPEIKLTSPVSPALAGRF